MRKLSKSLPTKRRSMSAAAIVLLSLAAVFIALPPLAAVGDKKVKEFATLTGDHQKQQFVAAKRVEISKAKVADDIFAAGQYLILDTVSAKHIIAAGMSLSLKDIIADDLILAGGQMDLSGNIKDDVIAAVCPFCPFGGRLHVAKTMQIGDDARLAGRDVSVDGRIGGDLHVAAQHFRLAGVVVGNARIEAERIVLAPGARIGGDLLYSGPIKPEVADGAVVAGTVRKVETGIPSAEGFFDNWIWYTVLAVLAVLLALFLLGIVLQLVAPKLMSNAAAAAFNRPWASLGRGLVLALLTPAVVALLMVTIIGIPIGLVTLAAFFILLVLAFVSISYCVGLFTRGLFSSQDVSSRFGSRIVWTISGILILVIVGLIPFIGWAIAFLAMIAGLGGVISQLGPVFRRMDTISATN